ncbi:MAG: phosphotriesterase [Cytophagaceae bacterium]|nr:phosphotriesterase [Cytophagaceae bacterium]
MHRRSFFRATLGLMAGSTFCGFRANGAAPAVIQTVLGPIRPNQLGTTLIHEHILVDFIGADKIMPERWKHEEVIAKVLPYLLEIKQLGFQSLIECTPAFLGRDPILLRKLSEQSGLHLLTNTGYYAAAGNKFLPPHAFTETAEQLAARWIVEFKEGIDGTGIRPGFMKISVNAPGGKLDETDRKIVRAAALTHRQTGLTIASHTGIAAPAREEIDLIEAEGVHPSAFIWVHAQAQALSLKNLNPYLELARRGAWVSLDGVATDNVATYAELLDLMKEQRLLKRVLLSHDAGWYRPGEPNGGEFRPYTAISRNLLPELKKRSFTKGDLQKLFVQNPAEAFMIRVRNR